MGQENQTPEPAQPGLFGWVPRLDRGRGRPPHEPSEKSRNKVKLLLAFNRTQKQIANALGISEPTLRKVYFSELRIKAMARDALEAEIIAKLWEGAEAGNVGAIKQIQARLDRADMEQRAREAAGEETEDAAPARRPMPKGKKEAARNAAEDLLARNPLLDPRVH